MKYFFDFDDFFIYTENRLAPDFFQFLTSLTGATQEEVHQTYKQFSGAHFTKGIPYSLEQHIDFLAELRSFDTERVKEKAHAFFIDLTKYVFEGTEIFLQSLPKEDVYLLTYGELSFQNLKVDGSGLRKYFREVVVVEESKPVVIERIIKRDHFFPKERVIFGDNRCGHFTGARKRGIITVHLKRETDIFNSEICLESEYIVNNFEELLQVLKNVAV